MSETPLTHELFARLMSLPPDHPERAPWNGRPEFESMRALYQQFEVEHPTSVSARELREAEAELKRRFRGAVNVESGPDRVGSRPVAMPARMRRSWWDSFPRPAMAAAAVLIVAVAGVWFTTRPLPTATRGAEDVPVILEPRRVAEGLEIRWTAVAGAESYRLSFVDDSMREIAAVEAWPRTSYVLEASTLPPGLAHGAHVILQIQLVRDGTPERTAATRAIVVP